MTNFFDKDGTLITDVIVWAKKFEDNEYRRVAATATLDGKYFVSTIWEGIPRPVILDATVPVGIFETKVFGTSGEIAGEYRWDTLAEAMAGHDMAVHRFGGEDE